MWLDLGAAMPSHPLPPISPFAHGDTRQVEVNGCCNRLYNRVC
jgi:hypothetical protein